MKAFDANESKYVSDSELTFKLKKFCMSFGFLQKWFLDSFRYGFLDSFRSGC
jgi:hypothetical protein